MSVKTFLEEEDKSYCSDRTSDEVKGLLEGASLDNNREWRGLKWRLWISIAVNAILGATSAILVVILSSKRCKDPSISVWSPANEAVAWTEHKFTPALAHPTEYMGFPDDNQDRLWEALFQYNTSVISKEEAQKLRIPTMAIPGTEQYLVELSVFHDLHCVNEFRKMLYPERYGLLETFKLPDGSINRTSFGYKHWEHCIDALRQTLMCNADVAPISFHVNVPFNRGIYPRLATTHSCRDFSLVQQWAREHHAQGFQGRVYNLTMLQEIIDDTDIDHSTEEDLQGHPDLFPGDKYFHYWREHSYEGEAERQQIYPTKNHNWEETLWG